MDYFVAQRLATFPEHLDQTLCGYVFQLMHRLEIDFDNDFFLTLSVPFTHIQHLEKPEFQK